jgi:hypothetical protein
MLTAALAYAARGWHIFPCKPGLKVPATQHGVKDASRDPETIRAWWTRWPDANIALACGPASGVYVVDVDVDTEKGINGWDSVKDFPDLPETVQQASPRGGAHFLFKTDKPPRNKNSFRTGIDIRSDGYYIMLAPSIHPNGKAYEWGIEPGQVDLAEFPDFMRPPEPAKSLAPWDRKPAPAPAPAHARPGATPIIDRARLYLQECEPATQGQAGHDKLLWAARALVVGFELDEGTALSLLWDDFNPRCNPQWDRSKAGDVKDFERKAREAIKTPGQKLRGWLLDELGLRGHDEAMDAYADEVAEGILAGVEEPTSLPHILVRSEIGKESKSGGGRWTGDLLKPSGFVGDLAKFMEQTAKVPQPKLAVLSSFVAAGALMGGKIKDCSNGRTNIFGMGVAPSSGGKDHQRKVISELFVDAGADRLLGAGRVTSDSALEVALVASWVQLFLFDEAGDFFSNIKQAGQGSAAHLGTIKPALKELWSSANCLYRGKQRAIDEVRKILEPHVCLWMVTTPEKLYDGVGAGDIADGFIPRIVIAISHDWSEISLNTHVKPPSSLVSIAQAWDQRVIQAPEGSGNIGAAIGRWQLLVPTHDAAMSEFASFGKKCTKLMREAEGKNDKTAPIWGKCLEQARRFALTHAAGDRYDNPEIQRYHAHWACEYMQASTLDLIDHISQNMSENLIEKDKQRIVSIIGKTGRRGMSKAEFSRDTQFLNKRTRDGYITELMESGQIVFGTHPDHPGARGGWLWKHPFGLDLLTEKQNKENRE